MTVCTLHVCTKDDWVNGDREGMHTPVANASQRETAEWR